MSICWQGSLVVICAVDINRAAVGRPWIPFDCVSTPPLARSHLELPARASTADWSGTNLAGTLGVTSSRANDSRDPKLGALRCPKLGSGGGGVDGASGEGMLMNGSGWHSQVPVLHFR